jgi:cyclophilin family peptidyl-prolyl cis-trans isomerase
MNTNSRWLVGIVIVIAFLAAIQWFLNASPKSAFNQYGNPPATSTPATGAAAATNTPSTATAAPASTNSSTKNFMHTVTIETNKGTIVFETYDADAPNTVKNFISLANKGFYNGLIFHRVIQGFMIQGGDPTGTGMGGPGYQFADELNPNTPSYKAGYVRGTVAMANSGPDTNGSQFFIMQKDNPLPHNYSIFGKVISGMDVVDAIASTPTNSNDKPATPITMTKVTVADTK